MGRWIRTARRLAVVSLAAGLVSGCAEIALREQDIYRPQPGGALTAAAVSARATGYTLEPQTITAPDGVRLTGALLRRPGAQRTVLYFGGNQTVVSRTGPLTAAWLAPLNVNIMLADYRGYGASGAGTPATEALMSDALAVFDHLASLPGVRPAEIVVHGQSLGSFMAAHVAAHRSTGGVVLESSATTAEAFARANVPIYARPFVRLNIAEGLKGQGNLQHMRSLDEPLLLLVGAQDEVTPPSFSRALFGASSLPPERRRLAVIEGAGHNDVLTKPAAIAAYRDFLGLAR